MQQAPYITQICDVDKLPKIRQSLDEQNNISEVNVATKTDKKNKMVTNKAKIMRVKHKLVIKTKEDM